MLDKSKKEKKRNNIEPLINERIKYNHIRLIDVSGSQLGIYSFNDALNMASNAGLDLVMISEKSDPPVCRIIDYGKYKFTQDKKAKEARKKQHNVTIKEVKMRYKIDVHDYNVRINQALRFLQAGDKVKANVTFRGREIQHANLAVELLDKMAQDLSHIAEIQQPPAKDGKNIIMILSPKKI
uniref:Translation initiation factor IF-3, chloroplastic n=2 Tax=Gracilariopsis lemaneiformis TaxID=2782 RepID=A0A2Z1FCC7_GRALE|nr:translation initiation factor 3 [Gracilariopsis lemaneiformis]AML79811.1 translation initiation factor 3 [Gracilariopsis lemaneiformis]UAD88811.1 translation initiation factor 3 [Gracilariopsis chorda]